MEPSSQIKYDNYPTAKTINNEERKRLTLDVIKGKQSITDASNENNVSRKFIHKLKNKALDAIDECFAEDIDDKEVLYYVPVTMAWVKQFVLCLLLHGYSSYRGIMKILEDILDFSISLGTISNIVNEATKKAKIINLEQDLQHVNLAANDELFHNNKPILCGVDIKSLYCYLLTAEDSRDQETWAIHLWDLKAHGYNPDRVCADDAGGLRAAHKDVLPNIPCDADHFHVIMKLTAMRRYFQNRLKSSISYVEKLERKIIAAMIKGNESESDMHKLTLAIQHKNQMEYLSHNIDTLVNWMQYDILNKAGVNPKVRQELFDFVLHELKKLSKIQAHRISDVCTTLQNQREQLLAFVHVMQNKFENISKEFSCPVEIIWDICDLQRCKHGSDKHAIKLIPMLLKFGDRFYDIEDAVIQAMSEVEPTSSMVENLNGRVRQYLDPRKNLGRDYLELIRFYLNHVKFLRSRTNRAGKTPAELMTNQKHEHWLEMLGFEKFKRAA